MTQNITTAEQQYGNIQKEFTPNKYQDIETYIKVWETQFMPTIDNAHFEKKGFLNEVFFQALISFLDKTYTDPILKKEIYEGAEAYNLSLSSGSPIHKVVFKNTFPIFIKKSIQPYFERQQLHASFEEGFYTLAYTPIDDGYGVSFITIDGQYEGYITTADEILGRKVSAPGTDIKDFLEERQAIIKTGGWNKVHQTDTELVIIPAEHMKKLTNIAEIRPFIQGMNAYIQANQDAYKMRVDEIISNGMAEL